MDFGYSFSKKRSDYMKKKDIETTYEFLLHKINFLYLKISYRALFTICYREVQDLV